MKIKVVTETGSVETIDLPEGPVLLIKNPNPEGLSKLELPNGMQYFFAADGSFDGWGYPIPAPPVGL